MSFLRAMRKLLRLNGQQQSTKLSPRNLVMITGCDSGLGFSLAVYCHSLNMTVISACHNINSEGACLLRNLNEPKRMITIELDLLKQHTIDKARAQLEQLLQLSARNNGSNGSGHTAAPATDTLPYEFTALINNAGVMCFGEFEWQTQEQVEMQINVNLLGTMRLTKALLPLIRQQKARIINVTSHCGLQALPALAPYAASKAALRYWNDSLRIEMAQYGVHVVNFIPGSFVMASNISARQQEHAQAMLKQFNAEQLAFYGDYFKRFNDYLRIISGHKAPNLMHDEQLLLKFKDALISDQPKSLYIHEPWRYSVYRMLFRLVPTPIADWLTIRFCAMPTYESPTHTNAIAYTK